MANTDTDARDVAITAAVFTLLISICTRIESSFDFAVLNVKHSILVDNFNELLFNYEYSIDDPQELLKIKARLISVMEMNHLQAVHIPC